MIVDNCEPEKDANPSPPKDVGPYNPNPPVSVTIAFPDGTQTVFLMTIHEMSLTNRGADTFQRGEGYLVIKGYTHQPAVTIPALSDDAIFAGLVQSGCQTLGLKG